MPHNHHHHHDYNDRDFSQMEAILQLDFKLKSEKMIEFLEKVGLAEGWHILEVGCGFCPLLPHYLQQVGSKGSVTLSDTEAKFGEKLKPMLSDARVRFIASSAEQAADNCRCHDNTTGYDLIVLGNAYHHLEDCDKAIESLTSLLRPGGHLVVFDFLHNTHCIYSERATRLQQLLRPDLSSVSARCQQTLAAAGKLRVAHSDSYVLQGTTASMLWQHYCSNMLPFGLDHLVGDKVITQQDRDDIVNQDLPAIANDPNAILFSDIFIQVHAIKL